MQPIQKINQKYDMNGRPLTISGINSNLQRNLSGPKIKNDFQIETIDEQVYNDFEISEVYNLNHSASGRLLYLASNNQSQSTI